jgi:protein-disulfide isomerase
MTNARTAKNTRDKAAELRAEVARREARRRSMIALAAVAAVIAVIVGSFVLVQNTKRDTLTSTAASALPANVGDDGSIVVGKASAPVTLTVYEDFQCPACLSFEQANGQQIKTWVDAGTVKVSYRPIAFLDRASTTRYSTRSLNAAAAVVASAPDAFPAFHDALFASQPAEGGAGLPDQQLIDLAVEAGAPKDKVTPAIEGLTYEAWTAKVTDQASKDGVNQTPTLLVNGTKLDSFAPDTVKQAVEAAAK